jgi:hypothetical protein
MGETCRTQRTTNSNKIVVGEAHGMRRLGSLGVDGKLILKRILKKL